MTPNFEVSAARGDNMPHGLTIVDQACYQALAHLYARYRAGFIERDSAVAEKRKILQSWEAGKHFEKLTDYHVEVMKETENVVSEFQKNKTIENAEKIIRVLDGIDKPMV